MFLIIKEVAKKMFWFWLMIAVGVMVIAITITGIASAFGQDNNLIDDGVHIVIFASVILVILSVLMVALLYHFARQYSKRWGIAMSTMTKAVAVYRLLDHANGHRDWSSKQFQAWYELQEEHERYRRFLFG